MLVRPEPDGTWTIDGVSFDEVRKINPNLYGALCKLKDYEATGLEPSDFRADKYEKTYAYKVHYSKSNSEDKTINNTNRRRVKDAIFSKLSDGMLIIVDEAQELSYPAVNALRSISDHFEAKGETVGLAFVGNPCFYNKFNGRYTNDRVQVSSRFVTEPTYNAEQIQLEDTMMLYPQLAQQNMMREIMFLHCIATTPSLGQRKALFIFKNAYNFGKYDLDSLVKTAKEAKVHFDNLNEILHKIKNIPER